jgi:H(+)-transporting ATP synthase subunit D
VETAILGARRPAVVLLAGKGCEEAQKRKDGPEPCIPDGTLARRALDEARMHFEKVKELTTKLSMVENSAYRLASSIRKTQKRANALKNITIPTYQNLVTTIGNALEEKDREEFTRLKVIKRSKTG